MGYKVGLVMDIWEFILLELEIGFLLCVLLILMDGYIIIYIVYVLVSKFFRILFLRKVKFFGNIFTYFGLDKLIKEFLSLNYFSI